MQSSTDPQISSPTSHSADIKSDEYNPLIEPGAIIYLINQYKETRKRKDSGFITTTVNAFKNLMTKDSREIYCDEFIARAKNINKEGVLEFLERSGKVAEEIQQLKGQEYSVTDISEFMQVFHQIRQYVLWKFYDARKTPAQREAAEILTSAIQIRITVLLVDSQKQKERIKQDQIKPHIKQTHIASLQKRQDDIMYELAYLGHTTHLTNFHVRNALFPSKIYYLDDSNPDYALPILQRNFTAALMRHKDKALVAKTDEEIIGHLENKGRKEYENEHIRNLRIAQEKERTKQIEAKEATTAREELEKATTKTDDHAKRLAQAKENETTKQLELKTATSNKEKFEIEAKKEIEREKEYLQKLAADNAKQKSELGLEMKSVIPGFNSSSSRIPSLLLMTDRSSTPTISSSESQRLSSSPTREQSNTPRTSSPVASDTEEQTAPRNLQFIQNSSKAMPQQSEVSTNKRGNARRHK